MKKLILALALMAGALTASAKEAAKNDTIKVDNTKIEKVIETKTTNSKGEAVTKYYILYDKQLISTSKNVVEMYNSARNTARISRLQWSSIPKQTANVSSETNYES